MLNWKRTLLALSLLSGTVLAETASIVRFDLTDSIKAYLKANELDVTGVNYKTNEIEAHLTQAELKTITSLKTTIKFSFPQNLAAGPDEEYKNPEEIEDFIKQIHDAYPGITDVKSIGKSLEGRDIWAIKISDNAAVHELEPSILVNAMHHAREVMTPEITTDMVDYLVKNYGKDPKVTKWIDNNEIWVIPMFNVDGNNKMWTKDSMWRKNTRDGHGVDINRNYPTAWNTCNGSSSNRTAQDYRGTAPASEPETQAMINFVKDIRPVFDISYHSYSEIVIYPYGCKPKRTPANEAIEMIGAEIGKKLDYKPGTSWELLYNTDGGDIDWMYTEAQVIPYVIEVNSTSQGFHPDYKKWRDKTVLKNRLGWMHLLERLDGPNIQGSVNTGEYSVINVFKAGEATAFQSYKINADGSFYIILKSGTYDFSFEGAKSKKVSNVLVNAKKVISI